jgi:hypothetical protein
MPGKYLPLGLVEFAAIWRRNLQVLSSHARSPWSGCYALLSTWGRETHLHFASRGVAPQQPIEYPLEEGSLALCSGSVRDCAGKDLKQTGGRWGEPAAI